MSAPATCPKCGHPRPDPATSCARCGLVFAKWSPEEASGVVAPLDERAEALWADALASWNDEGRHDAFLKHCSAAGLLAAAGRRYRARLDERPGDQVTVRMQERVLHLATVAFTVQRSRPPEPITRKSWFWLVLATCGALGIAAAFLLR